MKLKPQKKLKLSELNYGLGDILNHARRVLRSPMLEEVDDELRRIAKQHLKKLQRLGYAARHGDSKAARSRGFHLCQSFGSRIISFLIGYPKNGPKLSWAQVKTMANMVNPRIPSHEPVVVKGYSKPEGGIRTIQVFGPISRANQSLTRDIIYASMGPSPIEYAQKGRGRDALMTDIDNANRNKGVQSLGVADVKNCYPSITTDIVRNVVNISPRIIKHSIFVSHETPIHSEASHISESAVRSELSQGSLSSPLVASKVMEKALQHISTRFVGVHGDNIVFGTKSVPEAEAILDTLAQALGAGHLGAPLFLKYKRALKIGEHVDVCGGWARPNPKHFGGGIRYSPSNQSLRRFYVKLATILLQIPYGEWDKVVEQRAYAYAASAKFWGGRIGGREAMQTVFWECMADLLDSAHEKVLNAIDAGFSDDKIKAMAGSYGHSIIPQVVLANSMGLMKSLAGQEAEQQLLV